MPQSIGVLFFKVYSRNQLDRPYLHHIIILSIPEGQKLTYIYRFYEFLIGIRHSEPIKRNLRFIVINWQSYLNWMSVCRIGQFVITFIDENHLYRENFYYATSFVSLFFFPLPSKWQHKLFKFNNQSRWIERIETDESF